MKDMLDQLLGSKTASMIFLYLTHYGEAYANGISRDLNISLNQIQRQLNRFENVGVIISQKTGNTRIYKFNPKSPLTTPFKGIVSMFYNSMSLREKEQVFAQRRRPRRPGKPVIAARKAK